MFDLKKDKNEMTNLYSNPEHKGKVQELKKGLKGLLDKYDVEVDKK